jgi:hypothetical protein
LLNILFVEYNFFLPTITNLLIVWGLFFKSNFLQINLFFKKKDYLSKNYSFKVHNPQFYITTNKLIILLNFLAIFFYKNYVSTFWWNHFKLLNINFNLVIFFLTINYLYLLVIEFTYLQNLAYKSEFFFALTNLTIFLPFIFFINTLFTFFFFIELNSSLIFYKFINSTSFFFKKKGSYKSNPPKYFINMLFFQYWAAFFSSILFVYVILISLYLYNSTEWVLLNFFTLIQITTQTPNYILISLINFILIISFLLKIGLTPLNLYKLEVYKGLPYISIFFYTTFYFLVFFLFFVLLILDYLGILILTYWYIFICFLLLGVFYTINLLFNVNLLKVFFAYSTIINSLGFICGVFSLVNL